MNPGFEVMPVTKMPKQERGRRMRLAMIELKKAGKGYAVRFPVENHRPHNLQTQAYRTAKRLGVEIFTHQSGAYLWIEMIGECEAPVHIDRSRAINAGNILRSLGR